MNISRNLVVFSSNVQLCWNFSSTPFQWLHQKHVMCFNCHFNELIFFFFSNIKKPFFIGNTQFLKIIIFYHIIFYIKGGINLLFTSIPLDWLNQFRIWSNKLCLIREHSFAKKKKIDVTLVKMFEF